VAGFERGQIGAIVAIRAKANFCGLAEAVNRHALRGIHVWGRVSVVHQRPEARLPGQPSRRREVVGEFHFRHMLFVMVPAVGAGDQILIAALIGGEYAAKRRDGFVRPRRSVEDVVGKRLRLALRVEPVVADPVRKLIDAVADEDVHISGDIGLVALEPGEVLACGIARGVHLEMIGHAGGDRINAGNRIAAVERGQRTLDHVDAVDFGGRNHTPARRIGEAVAEVVREQHAIGVDHRSRAVLRVVDAAFDGRVAVADEAFADEDAGKIFEGLRRRHDVDGLVDLLLRSRGDDGDVVNARRNARFGEGLGPGRRRRGYRRGAGTWRRRSYVDGRQRFLRIARGHESESEGADRHAGQEIGSTHSEFLQ